MANPGRKPWVRGGLWIPVGFAVTGFYGQPLIYAPLLLIALGGVFYTGKKYGWKWRWTIILAVIAAIATVMVYSMFVDVPNAMADRSSSNTRLQHEGVYFIYEDHIGRPVLMTEYSDSGSNGYDKDASGNTYWKASYKPFGQIYTDNGSVGITVGTSPNNITWEPPFRFPGQYADPELGGLAVYNHFRFYLPGIGRYNSADPYNPQFELSSQINKLKNAFPQISSEFNCSSIVNRMGFGYITDINQLNLYNYSSANPITNYDVNGLFFSGRNQCESYSACVKRCWTDFNGHYAFLFGTMSWATASAPLIGAGGAAGVYFTSLAVVGKTGAAAVASGIGILSWGGAALLGWGVGTAIGCEISCAVPAW